MTSSLEQLDRVLAARNTFDPGEPVSGPSFGLFFKLLTGLLTFGLAGWFVQLYMSGALATKGSGGVAWMICGIAMIGLIYVYILISRTSVNSNHILQTWMWDKKVLLSDIIFVRIIRVRGLAWLVAPRLYMRLLDGKFTVIYFAGDTLTATFERLAAVYQAPKK